MAFSDNFIKRPVLTTVCSILIVLMGLIAIPNLPIANLPNIAPPLISVTANYGGGKTTTNSGGLTHVWGDTRRDTITFGDSLYLDWENYREVTVTLAKNDEEWRDGGPLNFPVASDTFLVADVFPGL